MADTATIKVFAEGWEHVAAQLKALGGKLARRVIRQALRSGAKPVHAAAITALETDNAQEWEDTGQLRRSIKVRAGKRSRGSISIRVATADGWFKGEEFYGAFREFGHKIGKRANNEAIGIRKRKKRNISERQRVKELDDSRSEVRPYKFVEPAYTTAGPQAVTIIEREILAGIEREARSGN